MHSVHWHWMHLAASAAAFSFVTCSGSRRLSDPSTPSMVKNSATLSKLVDQTFVEIITGSKDVSALDDLQQEWLTLGGQSILDEVNA